MFDTAAGWFRAVVARHPWTGELAGILPISAVIDFIEVAPKLHVFQLNGAIPLWSWPITPSGSRLLLGQDRPLQDSCYLDRFGNSVGLLGMDGRYGDRYFVSSPETIRLAIEATRVREITNAHVNMSENDLRRQNLEIVHVERNSIGAPGIAQTKGRRSFAQNFLPLWEPQYLGVSLLGWILWSAMVVMSICLQTWLSLAFLVLMPTTGFIVFIIYGNNPRRLLVENKSDYNRLIVVAEHENTTDWKVFYGESTVLNNLLNRPLEPTGSRHWLNHLSLLRMVLRLAIVGQWALAIGAACTKNLNAYFITFWILFCVLVHAYAIPPPSQAKAWCESFAGIQLKRYTTVLSSRRALLNTIIALNPDTFALSPSTGLEDRSTFQGGATKWLDRILEPGPSRTKWEHATLEAMNQAPTEFSVEGPAVGIKSDVTFLTTEWNTDYRQDYWNKFIPEGMYMAALIREKAKLPGRRV